MDQLLPVRLLFLFIFLFLLWNTHFTLLCVSLDILARGFRDGKYGDRFYYENSPSISPYAFSPSQLASIRQVRLSTILCSTLKLTKVPQNAFLAQDTVKNPFVMCSTLPQVDLNTFKDSAPSQQQQKDFNKVLSSILTSPDLDEY